MDDQAAVAAALFRDSQASETNRVILSLEWEDGPLIAVQPIVPGGLGISRGEVYLQILLTRRSTGGSPVSGVASLLTVQCQEEGNCSN